MFFSFLCFRRRNLLSHLQSTTKYVPRPPVRIHRIKRLRNRGICWGHLRKKRMKSRPASISLRRPCLRITEIPVDKTDLKPHLPIVNHHLTCRLNIFFSVFSFSYTFGDRFHLNQFMGYSNSLEIHVETPIFFLCPEKNKKKQSFYWLVFFFFFSFYAPTTLASLTSLNYNMCRPP